MSAFVTIAPAIRAGCVSLEPHTLRSFDRKRPTFGAAIAVETVGADGSRAAFGFVGAWIFRSGAEWVRDAIESDSLPTRGSAAEIAGLEAERLHPLVTHAARRLVYDVPTREAIARDLATCLRVVAARPEAESRMHRIALEG